MADNIVDIDFTNVVIDGEPVTGTVAVDYTTGTISGTLTAHFPSPVGNVTFTNFSLTENGSGSYSIVATHPPLPAGINVTLNYSGQQPSAFTSGYLNTPLTHTALTISPNVLTSTPVCFAAGTLIRTPAGDVAVETLKAGDLVLTASGDVRPVKWIGHKDFDFRLIPGQRAALPIRIVADALGPNRPSQDLYLSAGHSICVDVVGEVFIPVGRLINGGTIAQVETDTISYWHVELDSHDVLLANNLPTESYLAMGNRGAFEEMHGFLPAMLDGRSTTHADFCRPVVTHGPILDFVSRRLATRAEEIGWTRSCDPDLRLVVDGKAHRPLDGDGASLFLFPSGARDVRLVSNTLSPTGDSRKLGVMLTGLSFSGRAGEPHRVAIDDGRLCKGVYPVEAQAGHRWRWTNGEFVLDPQLWAGLEGGVSVLVAHNSSFTRAWLEPEKPSYSVADELPRLVAAE